MDFWLPPKKARFGPVDDAWRARVLKTIRDEAECDARDAELANLPPELVNEDALEFYVDINKD